MAISSCFCHPQFSLKMDRPILTVKSSYITRKEKQRLNFTPASTNGQQSGQHFAYKEAKLSCGLSFLGGSREIIVSKPPTLIHFRKNCRIHASWWTNPSTIANNVFTLGTVAVLPFYTLMLVAPKAELTQKSMESSIPYIVLGVLYACLLYLSWSPDTLRLMFASKYWLPELPGIAKMFSNEITLASAWLHLLAIDLYAARQVYKDGIENKIETRHSVSICLLFCPIGIIVHYITKYLTISPRNTKQEIH